MCKMLNKYLHFSFPPCHTLDPAFGSFFFFFLLAGENLGFLTAGVALYKTAPVEFAVALPDAGVVVGVVTPAAAHHITAVCVRGGAVAQPASRPRASRRPVLLAVVGRALQVDQVRVHGLLVAPGLFEAQEGGLAEARGSHGLHLNCFAVALLQQVADLSELGQGDPAGLGGARAGNAVTLALQLHPLLQDLITETLQVNSGQLSTFCRRTTATPALTRLPPRIGFETVN